MRNDALIPSPSDLVAIARSVLADQSGDWGGAWARAVAFLTRQALEDALDGLWESRGLEMDRVSARAQLLCAESYLGDASLAADVRHAWGALSRACHHHPYELSPTVEELARWLDAVQALVDRVQGRSAPQQAAT